MSEDTSSQNTTKPETQETAAKPSTSNNTETPVNLGTNTSSSDAQHEHVKSILSKINKVTAVLLILGFLFYVVMVGWFWGTTEGGSIQSALMAMYLLGLAFIGFLGYVILPLFIAEKAAVAIHKNRANKRYVKRVAIIILCMALAVSLLFLENRRENMAAENAQKNRQTEWANCLQENTPYEIKGGSNLYQPAVDHCNKVIK